MSHCSTAWSQTARAEHLLEVKSVANKQQWSQFHGTLETSYSAQSSSMPPLTLSKFLWTNLGTTGPMSTSSNHNRYCDYTIINDHYQVTATSCYL